MNDIIQYLPNPDLYKKIAPVLRYLGIDNAELLGAGMTSATLVVDEKRAVRIHGDDQLSYVQKLQAFYDMLPVDSFPYQVPQIFEIGIIEGIRFHVERRLPGREMAKLFPLLTSIQRRQALDSFLAALEPISRLHLPERQYGEVLGYRTDITNVSWPAFLWQMAESKLKTSKPKLSKELPELDGILRHFQRCLEKLPASPPKQLVHGDYFFGNVLLGEDLRISAVLDFSPMSYVGDGILDLVGALYFCEIFDFVTESDLAYLSTRIKATHGASIWPRMQTYLTYYCIYFSDLQEFDPIAYAWSLRNLRNYWLRCEDADAAHKSVTME